MTDYKILPDDLAALRYSGRLTLSRSPITRRWRIVIPEVGFDESAPSRHDLFEPARKAAQKLGVAA
jgi:hypothetical protein